MMRKSLLVVLFLLTAALAEEDLVVNQYSVIDLLDLCEIRNDFEKDNSNICDPAGLIALSDRVDIENRFEILDVTRFNVIVVPSIADLGFSVYQSRVDIVIHRFALDLFNGLNIVKDSRKYDRALIFVSRDQHSAAVICDADMLPKISSAGLDDITVKAIDYVSQGEISTAIEVTIRRINLIVSAEGNSGSSENMESHMTKARLLKARVVAPKIFAVLFFIFFMYTIFERNVENQLIKGKVTLGHILDELNRSVQPSSLKHRRASCPTCLDRFTELDGFQFDGASDYTEEMVDTTEEKMVESDAVDDVSSSTRKIDVNKHQGCLLGCGHEFCQTCLQLHLLPKNNMLCPICLKEIEVPSEYSPHSPPGGGSEGEGEDSALLTSIYAGTDHNETLYRLQRIRLLYPRVMSSEMLMKCQTAARENDLVLIRDSIQSRFETISVALASRDNLLKESVLGDRFALSNAHASR